jgi:hypothetical protein
MNTFRLPTRRIHARRYQASLEHPEPIIPARKYRAGVEGRQFLALAAVCAAIFAGSFAVAHEGSTASSPREVGQWAVPVVSAGSPVPVHLSSAPTIEIEPVVAPRPHAVHAATGQAVARAPLAEGRAVVTPALPTSRSPATPVSPQAPAPSPREQAPPSAPAPSRGSSGASPASATPSPEAGKSFDTSG